ncbi:hypothetical protein FHR72_000551 [Mycolicibacterium iranicum]|uniref:DUF4174 domain-containing protein n=1 Tax=Mycolicibacterium iranicum TaxID=912594 RepID=A0A839Q2D9_MYCIR|nr:DUF4174 domain-containing protein [Mycolicibacterium iranicum]MBB2989094.1 hypothetical protein [Mycolicibacterium iranicum]
MRSVVRLALLFTVLVTSAVAVSAPALATELGDYLWQRRPLLLFAPADTDPRLVETLGRIEAGECEFADRDMVTGVVVREGTSTLGGEIIGADEAHELRAKYAIDTGAFTALLIGKDGSEKFRVDGVPDLQTIYAVIDGMPMRGNEIGSSPSGC